MANAAAESLDFSQPWQLSDVVLVVEGERFNVHRNILGMWSEVFATMFTAQFKEKTAKEVPLPGKKSSEIKEMLLVIYPTSAKPIDKKNYAFLLDLAKEYMMAKITEKCETFLMYGDEKPQKVSSPKYAPLCTLFHCLELLYIAQNYGLERLQIACIEKAKSLSLWELRKDKRYKKIKLSNYREIAEGKIEKLERELSNKTSELNMKEYKVERLASKASEAATDLDNIISIIVFAVCKLPLYNESSSIEAKISSIHESGGDLKNLAGPLRILREKIMSIK